MFHCLASTRQGINYQSNVTAVASQHRTNITSKQGGILNILHGLMGIWDMGLADRQHGGT